MNGVSTNNSIWLSGGGRYDLIDSVRIVMTDQGIRLDRGNFVTNGNKIYAGALVLDVSGSNGADISNSFIHLFSVGNAGIISSSTYNGNHTASGTWNANGSTIQSDASTVSISNTTPISYGNIIMNSVNTLGIFGSPSQAITFNKVQWLQTPSFASGGSRMDGVFIMDTLSYPLSSLNVFQIGGSRSYTINDTLIAFGTPCNPAFLRSATPGSAVQLSSGSCNFDLNFVNLRDINAVTCTAAQNKSIGTDEGGNSNWTITSIPGLTRLGNDTAIVCGGPLITLDAIGFGSIPGILYAWNTGSSTRTINVNAADTYSIAVTYGPGCIVSDSIIVSCSSILPLNSLYLRAYLMSSIIQLQWQVLSEKNINYFVVERSTDGLNFKPIASKKAIANGSILADYTLDDYNPLLGRNLYRIKQLNIDGSVAYSNTIKVDYAQNDMSSVSVYPNPIIDDFDIKFNQKGHYNLSLINSLGQNVWKQEVEITDSKQPIKMHKRDWPKGIYLLNILSSENNTITTVKLSII